MNGGDSYESAVYSGDAHTLAGLIVSACAEANAIPDPRVRAAVLGAGFVTALQFLDKTLDAPATIKRGGVADMLRKVLASWTVQS